ncbi:MAG: hypothetical protein OXI60_11255 [Acidiferrobacterales bacterium]|nr:hypothetical protein [Acidiferrobacterales bacterium]
MKKKRQGTEVFSLAFLDIVTCGFGAIILLLLITRPIPVEVDAVQESVDLTSSIQLVLTTIARLETELASMSMTKLEVPKTRPGDTETLDQSIAQAGAELSDLKADNLGLEQVVESLKRITIRATTEPEQRAPEVGGIPVDSDHVIFIVDTSGSMMAIWDQVIDVIYKVIDIHPKVNGFQILNDNGSYLIQGTRRKWIPDTPITRKNVKGVLSSWASFSNSSPVEGLEVALRTYAKRKENISVYIFGDEFTGSSYDAVIDTVDRLNIDNSTEKAIARIHAVGFISGYSGDRYATLMRYVTERNRGSFIGLPLR